MKFLSCLFPSVRVGVALFEVASLQEAYELAISDKSKHGSTFLVKISNDIMIPVLFVKILYRQDRIQTNR